jgi:hypothetical protein
MPNNIIETLVSIFLLGKKALLKSPTKQISDETLYPLSYSNILFKHLLASSGCWSLVWRTPTTVDHMAGPRRGWIRADDSGG